uniref:RRM domain-containing protein n=1 Tax=Emiliania huxleyi (strain CCMP1516) TaxID=280463 RepID=A0A0D3ID40_EMIH1
MVPLPAATELAALNAVFSQFGPIESIRATGYINFCNVEAAVAAHKRYADGATGRDLCPSLPADAPEASAPSMRMMMGASYGFLNFLRDEDAYAFWQSGQAQQPHLRGNRIFLNWAKAPGPVEPHVLRLVREHGASRHLAVRNISDATSADQLGALFRQFGEVESIQIKPGEGAQVNLTNIASAAAAKDQLDGLTMGQWKLVVAYTTPP